MGRVKTDERTLSRSLFCYIPADVSLPSGNPQTHFEPARSLATGSLKRQEPIPEVKLPAAPQEESLAGQSRLAVAFLESPFADSLRTAQ